MQRLLFIVMFFLLCGAAAWAEQSEQEARQIVAPLSDKYLTEWLVLGPFFPDDLETDFLTDVGGEGNIKKGWIGA